MTGCAVYIKHLIDLRHSLFKSQLTWVYKQSMCLFGTDVFVTLHQYAEQKTLEKIYYYLFIALFFQSGYLENCSKHEINMI